MRLRNVCEGGSNPEAGALSDSVCLDPHSAAAANRAEAAGPAHVMILFL